MFNTNTNNERVTLSYYGCGNGQIVTTHSFIELKLYMFDELINRFSKLRNEINDFQRDCSTCTCNTKCTSIEQ